MRPPGRVCYAFFPMSRPEQKPSAPLDSGLVRKAARLARIGLSEEECAALAKELGAILGWIDQLNEVETGAVEPFHELASGAGRMREDAPVEGPGREAVLANAPEAQDGFFVVPKVIG